MLTVQHERIRADMARISVTGRMMLGADSLQVEQLVTALLAAGVRDFVFDLEGLTHIDSTGIGRFIASYNHLTREPGATMRMAAAGKVVRAAFRVTKLDTIFPFFETVAQAETAIL